jgi:hypothetical protein
MVMSGAGGTSAGSRRPGSRATAGAHILAKALPRPPLPLANLLVAPLSLSQQSAGTASFLFTPTYDAPCLIDGRYVVGTWRFTLTGGAR